MVTQKETNHHKLDAGTREYFDIFEKNVLKNDWNDLLIIQLNRLKVTSTLIEEISGVCVCVNVLPAGHHSTSSCLPHLSCQTSARPSAGTHRNCHLGHPQTHDLQHTYKQRLEHTHILHVCWFRLQLLDHPYIILT